MGAKAKAHMGVENEGRVEIRGCVVDATIRTGDGNVVGDGNVIYDVMADELEGVEVGDAGAKYRVRAKKITGSAIGNGATVVNGRRSRRRQIKALLEELEELEELLDEDW